MSEKSAPAIGSATERYFRLDKSSGAPNAETLWEFVEKFSNSENPAELEIAASAIVESILFSPDIAEYPEDDAIEWINQAEILQNKATELYWQDLENHTRIDQTVALRSQVRGAFFDIYRDLVCGDVTKLTRNKTYDDLARTGRYTYKLGQYDALAASNAFGLNFEIATMMACLKDDSLLIPSSIRAGSGWYEPESTHDFEYLVRSKNDKILATIPIELKSLKFIEDEALRLRIITSYDPSQSLVIDAQKDLHLNERSLQKLFFSQEHASVRTIRRHVNETLNRSAYNWLEYFTAA